MAQLQRKKAKHEGNKAHLLSVIEIVRSGLAKEDSTRIELLALKSNLNKAIEKFNESYESLLDSETPDDIPGIVATNMKVLEPTYTLESEISVKLETFSISNPPSVGSVSTSSSGQNCKLPKLELPMFDGDPLQWQGFFEQFNASIHNNEQLTDIDRFSYLKRYLKGRAFDVVSGLSLNSANYKEAIALLKERFGDPQVLITAHMESLLKIRRLRSSDDVEGLRKLYGEIEKCVRNLRSLKVETSTYGCLLIPILNERLPDDLTLILSRRFGGDVWTLDLLLKYLNEEIQAKERCSGGKKSDFNNRYAKGDRFTASSLHVGSNNVKKCVFCYKEGHSPSQCQAVPTSRERRKVLRRFSKCFICLQGGHVAKDCTLRYECKKCGGRHHVSICFGDMTESRPSNSSKSESGNVLEGSTNICLTDGVLLQTALGKVCDREENSSQQTRFLFDSGSQRTYITEQLRRRLKLKRIRSEKIVIRTFGETNSVVRNLDVVKFKACGNGINVLCEALVVPVVCSPLCGQNINYAKYSYTHLKGLELADRGDGKRGLEIDVLIGSDYYYRFFTGKIIKGDQENGPVALKSIFGWVLSGSYGNGRSKSTHCYDVHAMKCSVDTIDRDDMLRKELNNFWNIESVKPDEKCVIHEFEKHIEFNGSRYVTRLPFRKDHDPLPDNYNTCVSRLKGLKKRLSAGELTHNYNEIFIDYEREGIIERVPKKELLKAEGEVHYLPHRPVIREDKETTKIRAVFDASCCSDGRPSLNDCLYPGPNLLAKILDILLRFRVNKIGIIADIKQAFLNVSVAKEHIDFLRFLWFEVDTEDHDIVIYRFLRVVFGVNSSPFLLNATIRHHLSKHLNEMKAFVEQFLRDLYVDDISTGVKNFEEGKYFYARAKSIMADAGFNLRKWVTNDSQLQQFIDSKEGNVSNDNLGDNESYIETQLGVTSENKSKRVLGVEWETNEDKFVFRFNDFVRQARCFKPTKRNILRVAASFYDPMGLISPITARVKIIFQLLCKDRLSWDENVPEKISHVWEELLRDLETLNAVRIPRFVCALDEELLQIHGFCDSSKQAYCAAVYFRKVTSQGVEVRLMAAKTRVAPIKELSIPKLELLSCVLLTELLKIIFNALNFCTLNYDLFCWTDSEVALCWLKGNNKCWKPWVENRVVKCRSVVAKEKWYHVSGKKNPADVPTRLGRIGSALSDVWFCGPEFLREHEFEIDKYLGISESRVAEEVAVETKRSCVKEIASSLENDGDYEMVQTFVTTESTSQRKYISDVIDVTSFSSFDKLIGVTCYVLRFVNNLKNLVKKNSDCIITEEVATIGERKEAIREWLISEQYKLRTEADFEKLKSSLNLFLDDVGCWRLKGRFGLSLLAYDVKFPVILRGKESAFTRLVVNNAHERVFHHGVETTLAFVRSKYWIVRGRNTVKNIIRKCVICKRFNGKVLTPPPPPDLPSYRIDVNYCFYAVGIDYAGPLFIREKDALSKVYIVIFSCATSRAIHLELVKSMDKVSFMYSFERFMSRKGKPKIVISDNAKTFKAKEVKQFYLQHDIQQKFILPASPWWGGFYERMVRSVKSCLRKSLGRSLIDYEQLETILCKVEAVINSRPLTYLSDVDIDTPLTPYRLMFGRNVQYNNVEIEENFSNPNLRKRLTYLKSLLRQFWKQFVSSYLNELRQMHLYQKGNSNPGSLKKGDVVLIKDDRPLPRYRWKIGRVVELVEGRDSHVRGAKLRTISDAGDSSSCYRPIQKLIPFEINEDCDESYDDNIENEIGDNARNVANTEKRTPRKAAIEGTLRRLQNC